MIIGTGNVFKKSKSFQITSFCLKEKLIIFVLSKNYLFQLLGVYSSVPHYMCWVGEGE